MRLSSFLAPLLTAATVAGCRPSLPNVPADGFDPSFEQATLAEPAGMPTDDPQPLTLAPGDVLTFRALGVEKLEQSMVVDAAGRVHVPTAGPVEVAGTTLPVAEARIAEALRVRDRFVQVALSFADNDGRRASVVGAVERPGQFGIRPTTRLADLLAQSGGPRLDKGDGELTDLADLGGGSLVRQGKTLPVSLSLAMSGDPHHNVFVHADDLVFVPAAHGSRVSVLGSVHHPRTVPFRRGLRLTEAVALAGGTSEWGDEADIRVVRGPLSHPHVYRADLKKLWRGDATDVLLAPGDVVLVTEHWFGSMTAVLQRLTPFLAGAALTVAVSK